MFIALDWVLFHPPQIRLYSNIIIKSVLVRQSRIVIQMISPQKQLFCIFLILNCFFICSTIKPQDLEFSSELSQICKQNNLTFFTYNLSQTVKGNSIQLLGMASKRLKTSKYEDFKGYPAVLITGTMHPRQHTSFLFIKSFLLELVYQAKNNNFQIQYLLQRVVFLVIPFVNIDGIKYSFGLKQDEMLNIRKNLNENLSSKCIKAFTKGVDINRNFDYKFGTQKTSLDPCGEEYHGEFPFSEKESISIKKVFEQFKVIFNVDVHSYGNIWIYPYAADSDPLKIKQSKLFPQYEYIFNIMQKMKINYANCYESLRYLADGVYIDWALQKGSISFALEFGDDFEKVGSELSLHIKGLLQMLKINVNAFKKYIRNETNSISSAPGEKKEERVKLCIKSFSTLDHSLILLINKSFIEGKQISPNQEVCFDHKFDTIKSSLKTHEHQTTMSDDLVEIQIGKSQIFQSIDLFQLEYLPNDYVQSPLDIFLSQLKMFLLVFGILCFIGSLCGLSIFCEKSISLKNSQQERKRLSESNGVDTQKQRSTNNSSQDNQIMVTEGQLIKRNQS